METTRDTAGATAPLDPEALRVDAAVEALLAEAVEVDPREVLLSTERPFAPWEVRNARHWRLPVLAGGGLVGASAFVGLLPLWRLGPLTATVVWTDLLAAAFVRPVEVFAASAPVIVRAVSAVHSEEGLFPVPVLLLGTAAVGAATWLLSRSRPGTQGDAGARRS